LKRLGVQQIPGIEEINMFKEDGTVIHFTNPKFQASGAANTYVVSGRAEHKKIQDLLPGILDQLPSSNIPGGMNKFAEVFKSGLASGAGASAVDDDIPDLVENFDTAAAPAATTTASADSGAAPSAEQTSAPAPAATTTSAADTGAAPKETAPKETAPKETAPAPAATTTTSSDSGAAPSAEPSDEEKKKKEEERQRNLRSSKGVLLGPTGKPISSIPQGLKDNEVITCVEKFKALDADNSGNLDKKELRDLLKATVAGNMSDNLLDRFVNGQFENIDSDKSGSISFEEFLVAYAKLKSQ